MYFVLLVYITLYGILADSGSLLNNVYFNELSTTIFNLRQYHAIENFRGCWIYDFQYDFFLESSLPSHLKDQIPPPVRDLGFNLSHAMTNALKEKIYQFDSFKLNQYCDHVNVGGWTICQQGHHYAPFENNLFWRSHNLPILLLIDVNVIRLHHPSVSYWPLKAVVMWFP